MCSKFPGEEKRQRVRGNPGRMREIGKGVHGPQERENNMSTMSNRCPRLVGVILGVQRVNRGSHTPKSAAKNRGKN